MKTLLSAFILCLFSINAYSWNTANLIISHMDVKSGGSVSVFFTFASDTPNPANGIQGDTFSCEGANPSVPNFLSTMLAAHAAGKKVQIQVNTGAYL